MFYGKEIRKIAEDVRMLANSLFRLEDTTKNIARNVAGIRGDCGATDNLNPATNVYGMPALLQRVAILEEITKSKGQDAVVARLADLQSKYDSQRVTLLAVTRELEQLKEAQSGINASFTKRMNEINPSALSRRISELEYRMTKSAEALTGDTD